MTFNVCRCCRRRFARQSAYPFCNASCAFDWTLAYLHHNPDARLFFFCHLPPLSQSAEGWQAAEFDALMAEVIG